jgi:pimeloyl-ACP methyl ester carboxylesterase
MSGLLCRRDVLTALAGAVAGAAAPGPGRVEAAGRKEPAPAAARRPAAIVTDDGARLHYKDWGSGRPVVLVHGWALQSDFWEYLMMALVGRGFRAVAHDRRGHGRSDDPGTPFDYDRLADDLAGVIAALDLRELTLVGHSMGGGEVIRYVSRHGAARVARAVLIAPTAPLLAKSADFPEGVDAAGLEALRAALLADRAKWIADNSAGFWAGGASPELMEWGRRMPLQCSLKTMVEATRVMSETDFRAELRRMPVPTLIVHGDADRSVPIHLGRLAAGLLPRGRFLEYAGAPHGLPLTHGARLLEDLLAFMNA